MKNFQKSKIIYSDYVTRIEGKSRLISFEDCLDTVQGLEENIKEKEPRGIDYSSH